MEVPITNTGDLCSESQVNNVAKEREEVSIIIAKALYPLLLTVVVSVSLDYIFTPFKGVAASWQDYILFRGSPASRLHWPEYYLWPSMPDSHFRVPDLFRNYAVRNYFLTRPKLTKLVK